MSDKKKWIQIDVTGKFYMELQMTEELLSELVHDLQNQLDDFQ